MKNILPHPASNWGLITGDLPTPEGSVHPSEEGQ